MTASGATTWLTSALIAVNLLQGALSVHGSDGVADDIISNIQATSTNKNEHPLQSSHHAHLEDHNTNLEPKEQHEHEPQTWLASLVLDGSKDISNDVFTYLVDLNCHHNFPVHLVVKTGEQAIMDQREEYIVNGRNMPTSDCAAFHVVKEPVGTGDIKNRVDRISHLRNFQRESIHTLMMMGGEMGEITEKDVVILLDSDLRSMGNIGNLLKEVKRLQDRSTKTDAICAAGVDGHRNYYDTFATVLLPNTFFYPKEMRLNETLHSEEDETKVLISNGRLRTQGKVGMLQREMVPYLESLATNEPIRGMGRPGKPGGRGGRPMGMMSMGHRPLAKASSPSLPVPVRSCFGGLTLYRAEVWFNPQCTYQTSHKADHMYANRDDERPCEHVVFHNCLRRVDSTFEIGVQPELAPIYHN
jgi:hypothetical protein